jgi:hypothetical protein
VTAIGDAIARHAVGGDADIAVCVLPDASVLVASREPKPLADLAPDVQRKLLRVANEIAIQAYEVLQAHGTNVIAESAGHAHYRVVARTEEDGLPLRWNPGSSTPKDLADLAGRIREGTWTIGKKDVTHVERPVVEEPKPETIARPEPVERPIADRDMHAPQDTSEHDLGDVAAEMQTRTRRGPYSEMDYRIKNLTRRR